MESTSRQLDSDVPVAMYRIIQWPACNQIPQADSSFKDAVPELSQNPLQMFEVTQTRDGIVATSNLPKDPAHLANEILKNMTDMRTLKKKGHGKLASAPQMCPYCDKSFYIPSQWRRHVNIHTGEVKYPCPLCEKVFLDKSTFMRHKKIHSGEKPWRCKMCGKSFHALPSLRRHITVHNPAGRPFECEICHKNFPDKSSYQKHIFTHTGLRPHLCKVCNKSFVHVGDLNCHVKIHDEPKEFKCPHCKKEFSKLCNYQRHIKIHEGKMLYRCPVCRISYNFRSSLTRHMIVHRQQKLNRSWIICRFCDARFLNRSVLKRHLLQHFSETVEKRSDTDAQSNNFIKENCDSRNDINKRPMSSQEIRFVKKNLKYCRVIEVDELKKIGPKIVSNENRRNAISISNEARQNRDVENNSVSSELSAVQLLNRCSKYRRFSISCSDAIEESNAKKCDVGILQKRGRGRPRKLHLNSLVSSSQDNRHSCPDKTGPAKSDNVVNTVEKRKRGRPRKVVNDCAISEIVSESEHNEMFYKLIKVSCKVDAKKKEVSVRPKRNLCTLPKKLPQIQEIKNTECIANQKRKRGRPRKEVTVFTTDSKHEIESKALNVNSRDCFAEHVLGKKRKRGRPRKTLLPVKLLQQCQSHIIRTPNEIVMNKHIISIQQQNHKEHEENMDGNVSEVTLPNAGEELLLAGTKKGFENCKIAGCETECVGNGHKQHGLYADRCNAEQSGENNQTSKNEEVMCKNISCHKKMWNKQILLTKSGSKYLKKNCKELQQKSDLVGKTKIFDGEIEIQLKRKDSKCKKEIARHNKQMCGAASLQEQLPENIHCADNANPLHTLFIGTKKLEESCCSVTVTPEYMLVVDPAGEKKLSKQRINRKIPVFIISDNGVIEDLKPGPSNENNMCVEENELEICELGKRIIENDRKVIYVKNVTEEALSHSETQGCQSVENVVTNMAEVAYIGNNFKKANPNYKKGCLLFQGGRELITEVAGSTAETTGSSSFVRQSVKEVLLDDWQSDDSQSSEILEIVWKSDDCGSMQS